MKPASSASPVRWSADVCNRAWSALRRRYMSLSRQWARSLTAWTAADVKAMMQNPKYRQSGGRARAQGAVGTCAHVGLKVDGTLARIPTACAGLVPLRSWGSGVR